MEFRVLGPLDVVVDGQARRLPATAELAVLALLVLNAGRVVTAETLIDALWPESPPANPGNALQVRVSKLRRALSAAGLPDTLVVTRRPGYLVEIDPERVDAHRFVRLLAEARRAAEQDAPAASPLYREALALWRGSALPEFAGQAWARAEATRLEEMRLAAVEERLDLELAAGRHTEVVAELELLVAEQPLRERLHGQLMLALYRSGRQADALAAYQRTRAVLDAELGLDPSVELRDLEQAILRQDAKLAAPARASTAAAPPLPGRLTSFVGRRRELEQVSGLVGEHRLVTLTGPGGVGKTTLAFEVARAAVGRPDGVWLVRLASVPDGDRLAGAIADALGIRHDGTVLPADEQLVRHLRERAVLVVLDNCEHLADACATLVERLLAFCPQLRLLTTSREPLGCTGEVQYVIAPLDTPPPDAAPAEVSAYDAVRLFVERAGTALPDFQLDEGSAEHVAKICRQVDGIPLAIELAAVRVKALRVADLAARLDDRFGLLTAGPRTADARQRTLRATVDWSHQLLTGPEQKLFRRLAVFRGGWSLDAAEEVCSGDGLDRAEVFGLLARLIDRSLVVADRGEGPRFHLLETLRQYAGERLAAAGEAAMAAAAHARFFTEVAERAEPALRGAEQGRWLRWLRTERDNIDAALDWCGEHATVEPDLGLRLVGALGWLWYFASRQDGGRRVAAMLAAAPGGAAASRARALLAQAVAARPGACIVHPAAPCAVAARQSLDLFTDLGDAHRAAYARTLLAVEGIPGQDVPGTRAMLDDADREFAAVGDDWGRALSLFTRMELTFATGDPDEATRYADQALALFRALGDHWGISAIQYHLGLALHRFGQLPEALQAFDGALAEGRRVGLANTVQYALAYIGYVVLMFGDADRAERNFVESHLVAGELGADGNPVAALGEALLARQRGDLATARGHYERALAMPAALKPEWTAGAMTGLGFIAELTGNLDTAESAHRRAWHAAGGSGSAGAAAAAAAVALEGLANVAAARGAAHTAARLLGTAAHWRTTRRCPANPADRHDIDRAAQRAREQLGEAEYQAVYATVSVPPDQLFADLNLPLHRP